MKLIKPSEARPMNMGRASAYDKAVEAAIEKQRSHYIQLKCQHYTTWEMDEYFSDLRPARNKMWCNICGKWREKMPKLPPPVYPDEPLF